MIYLFFCSKFFHSILSHIATIIHSHDTYVVLHSVYWGYVVCDLKLRVLHLKIYVFSDESLHILFLHVIATFGKSRGIKFRRFHSGLT